jgi:ribosomal-protein-alanine N-acetyltransferase
LFVVQCEARMKIEKKYFIRTARLGFRCWHEDDMDFALKLWGDYKVTRFIVARGKLSEEQVREYLEKEIATEKEYGIQYWPIFLLENHQHIGCCGMRPYDLSSQIYEIGFHIRSTHWRQGYAYEAAQAVIYYAFNRLKVNGLYAGHNPKNDGSRHLLKRLGFQYTHDEFYPPTSLIHPAYRLSSEAYAHFCKNKKA